MHLFNFPCSLLVALVTQLALSNTTETPLLINATALPANGIGAEYASACSAAIVQYYSSSSSWIVRHQWVKPTALLLGGTTFSEVTIYENATTLCDGHARVTYSPAISLSTETLTTPAPVTGTTTILGTYFSDYPLSAPTCSIQPSDCDPLWSQYRASSSSAATITPTQSLETPPCVGVNDAASESSVLSKIYGCGQCTMYGEGVQLVFFPTTVSSRDMCASTPTAKLTHYGPSAVATVYSGKNFTGDGKAGDNQTVVADGHIFTSGTAYISIATVYAVDRCSKTFGTPVMDAILAMPSESVLSLRYSQDHFQRLMETDKIMGYPVSYADFNTPIPWSAWNGQNLCDPGGYGGWACSVIYENSFKPQLAIPPQITDLSPDFKGCQMWYNGLYDPPLALHKGSSVATPTLPMRYSSSSTIGSAAPSSTAASPTVEPTMLPDEFPDMTTENLNTQAPTMSRSDITVSPSNSNLFSPNSEPWIQSFDIDGYIFWATGTNHQAKIGSVTYTSGGPIETLADGTQVSYGNNGLKLKGVSTALFDNDPIATPSPTDGFTETLLNPVATYSLSGLHFTATRNTAFIEIAGQTKTAVQTLMSGPVVFDGSTTLNPGGAATTLSNGEILSAVTNGLILTWTSTSGIDDTIASSEVGDGPKGDSDHHHSTKTLVLNTQDQFVTAATHEVSNSKSGNVASATSFASRVRSSRINGFVIALIAMVVALVT